MRFEIRRDPLVRPLLALFGANEARSFVEVDKAALRIRFGPFDETVPRAEIERAERSRWNFLAGIGWRLVPSGVGLIGSTSDVVCVRLRNRRKVRLFPLISVGTRRIYVSMERPDSLIEALSNPSIT